jgi:alkanesulfonate monooxygenase SsuD/methylene tetrahydromethanopterin reductase-like flavin-dependent oxidoreductase (luciferase family)
MQIGIELGGYWSPVSGDFRNLIPEMLKVVGKADQLGFDALVVGEHHFMDYGSTPSPLAILSHVAPFISIPRLVAAILMLPAHDPGVLAGDVALVDHLTKGRLEIGPGRGGAPYEFDRMCRPSDVDSLREIYEEKFLLLRKLLSEKNVTFKGKYCGADNATIMPPPLQTPHPAIWQTCQRNEAAYHSAKNGYHVFTSSLRRPMAYVQGLLDSFREGVKDSANPQKKPDFAHLQWLYVAKDDADAKQKLDIAYVKQQKFWGIFNNTVRVRDGIIPGVDMPDTVEDLARGLVIGTRDYVEDRLLEMKDMGIDLMVMKTGFGASNADELAGLDRFAEYIHPKIK